MMEIERVFALNIDMAWVYVILHGRICVAVDII